MSWSVAGLLTGAVLSTIKLAIYSSEYLTINHEVTGSSLGSTMGIVILSGDCVNVVIGVVWKRDCDTEW
jgi:hypothetical protein